MTIYETKCWGDTYAIRADWAQAASPVQQRDDDGQWIPTGWQVANVRHSSELAMRRVLMQIARTSGDDERKDTVRDVERAVARSELAMRRVLMQIARASGDDEREDIVRDIERAVARMELAPQ